MFSVVLALTLYYLFLLFLLTIGIFKLTKPTITTENNKFSVIIAARNEENNVTTLLDHLNGQDYPKDHYEVIIVDDRSEDKTSELVKNLIVDLDNIKLLQIDQNDPGGKKRALAKGIAAAQYPILAFTDADCLPPKGWLSELNRHFRQEVDFVAGYSPLIRKKTNLLLKLKNLERLSIYAVTAGSMGWNMGVTCTARNMAYRKSLYEKVNGFRGLEEIPSGDDDLMLQKMSAEINRMTFMFSRDSIVPSYDNQTLDSQINLETRRASKWKYYPLIVKIDTAFVFLFYLAFLTQLILFLTGEINFRLFAVILFIKIIAELIILIPFLAKMHTLSCLVYYPLAFVLHLPYFIFFALKGTFGKYRWK